MKYKRYGGYNTKTRELSHIYEFPEQVEMCYPMGKDTPELKIVEVEVKIKEIKTQSERERTIVDAKGAGLTICPKCKRHSVDESGWCYNGCSIKEE